MIQDLYLPAAIVYILLLIYGHFVSTLALIETPSCLFSLFFQVF